MATTVSTLTDTQGMHAVTLRSTQSSSEQSASRNKIVAIVQSNYIPWKGYFDLIASVDEFILLDTVQYTRRDWRNRNRIKTVDGVQWLTIPVQVRGRYHQRICDTVISDGDWRRHHLATLQHAYARAPFFDLYREPLQELYADCASPLLSEVNRSSLQALCQWLGIRTRISTALEYEDSPGRSDRLLHLCRQAGATEYVSGPAAKGYLDEELFQNQGVQVRYFDYQGYPEYPQLYPPFVHEVTILDVLFSVGPEAPRYIVRRPRP